MSSSLQRSHPVMPKEPIFPWRLRRVDSNESIVVGAIVVSEVGCHGAGLLRPSGLRIEICWMKRSHGCHPIQFSVVNTAVP